MFTGIITGVGRITQSTAMSGGQGDQRITVTCPDWDASGIKLGDSVCHNGVCLTVVAMHGAELEYDVSAHTLSLVAGLDEGDWVNLENSLRAGDRLGGHYVSGHIDGTGTIKQWQARGDSWLLSIECSRELGKFIAQKGSIAVHGVSLTVNAVADEGDLTHFEMNIIPHTRAVTAFRTFSEGMKVNLEVDMLARYVARMQAAVNN